MIFTCKKSEDPVYEPPLLKGWTAGSPYEGYGVILYTSDGGKNWIRQGLMGIIPNVIGGIFHTNDSGKYWFKQDIPVISAFRRITFPKAMSNS